MWLCDLHYRARFESSSKLHRLLDVCGYLVLVYGAANIQPVHAYLQEPRLLPYFVCCLLVAQCLWLLRWLEIALRSHDEESRRYSSLRLVDDLPACFCWGGAWAVHAADGGAFAKSPWVPLLLLLGSLWADLRLFLRVQRSWLLEALDPGIRTEARTHD